MTIAATLQKYLADHNVGYDLVSHEPTMSSMRTAEAGRVPGDRLAKGVVLRDKESYWIAVLPATHHVRLADIRSNLGQDVDFATEQVFSDCERGAVPPLGACYGVGVIIDDRIGQQADVYFEGGDHATLIHMSQGDFARLNATARHGSFAS
jgi:Ala-tRNA(Pro) deacylase